MRIKQKIFSLFLLTVFLMNISSLSIVFTLNESQPPTTVNLTPLRGEPGVYLTKRSPLFKNSNGISTVDSAELNSSSDVAFYQDPIRYSIEDGVEDDVDNNTSDVDSSSDVGLESNFDNAQGTSVDSQYMQIQEDLGAIPTLYIDYITSNSDTLNYFTHNHTVSGNNRLLVVTVETVGGTSVDNVTFGGQPLSKITSVAHAIESTPSIEVWSLLAPPTGTAEVEVYLVNGISDAVTIGVISYVGVDQITPIDGVREFEGNSKNPTTTISSRAGDLVQDAMATLSKAEPIIGSNQTLLWSGEMGGSGTTTNFGVGSTKNGSSSVTTEWTTVQLKNWVTVGINIRRAPAPYILDLEYQWTNAEYTKIDRDLAIYTGTLGVENLKVDVWSGSSTWVTIIDSLVENDWNNISVVPYLTSSTFTIRLKGADEYNDDLSDTWNIDLILIITSPENNLPIADNLTLTPDPLYGNDTLNLDYEYYDQDDDDEAGTEIFWYKLNITDSEEWDLISAYNGETVVYSSALFKGDKWKVTVKPHDGIEFGNITSSSNITVQNLPPQLSSVVVLPSNPLTTSTLMISYSYSDSDSDSEITGNREVFWYRNGFLQGGFTNSTTVPANMINKSETWYYEIRSYDGLNYSSWVLSSNVTVGNSIPTASALNITENPNTGDNLVATWDFHDEDGDTENTSWRIWWFKNNEHQSGLEGIKIVNSGNTSKGESWKYIVQIYDGTDYSGNYTLTPSIQILNTPPTIIGDPSITTNPTTEHNLEASWIWDDEDPSDSESALWIVRWYKDGILQPNNDSLTVDYSDTRKGEVWNYSVKVFDGGDYSIQYNSSTTTILNTAPSVLSVSITSSPSSEDDLDTSWSSTDIDGDNPDDYLDNAIIRWYNWNGSDWQLEITSDGNSPILEAGNTSKGETWYYTIQVYDGANYSNVYPSANVTILNTIPTITNPSFNQTIDVTNVTTINITYSYFDFDEDTEITSQRIVYWYKNGVYQPGKDNHLILRDNETTVGDYWQYILRVYDGTNYSSNKTSASVGIDAPPNNAPYTENLSLTANSNSTLEDLFADYDYLDNDGHLQTDLMIRWYKNGTLQPTYNDSLIVPYTATSKGDVWNFTIKVYDGLNWSVQNVSFQLTILNSIPVASELTITNSPTTIKNISISWIFYDDDSDQQNDFNVSWYIDNKYNSTFDNLTTIDYIWTQKGETWNYTLTVSDDEDNSIVYNSPITIILNSIPSVSNLLLTENPTTTADLSASWLSNDVDTDDSLTYNITWYRYGLIYLFWETTSTFATLNSGNTSKNENWYFNIEAFDGENYSLIGAPSPYQEILNTAPVIQGGNVDINPSTPIRGTSLTVIYNFTDVDNDSESGTQTRWYKDDILQPSFNNLFTIPGSEVVKGQLWHVQVTGGDGTAYSIPFNSTVLEIGNTAPEVTKSALSLFPSSPFTTSTLVASFDGTDADSDLLVNFRIVWLINYSIEVPELENSTEVSPSYTKKGQSWNFLVCLYDGSDWSIFEEILPGVYILNSKPFMGNITLTGGLNTSDDIILSYEFLDPDNDQESGTVIEWTIIHILEFIDNDHSNARLINIHFTAGDIIYCRVQPNDGEAYGDSVDSKDLGQYIVVGNSAPELSSQPDILNSDGYEAFFVNKNLVVNYTAIDPDQDESDETYWIDLDNTNYRWYQNGDLRSDLTGPIVFASNLNKNDTWIVSVQPVDGFGTPGSWGNSTEITILNSKISIIGLWFENGNTEHELTNTSYANVTLYIDFSYDDVDGDPNPDYEILWFWNNGNGTFVLRVDLGNQTREVFDIVKGQEWYVVMRLFDGEEWSVSKNSSIITIINSIPLVTSWEYVFKNYDVDPVTRVDEFFIEDENLCILYTYSDYDDDPNNTIIRWFKQPKDGSWIEMTEYENITIIPSVNIAAGDTWYVSIIPFDGSNEGIPVNSSHIIIISRPIISEPDYRAEWDKDGKYNITVNVTDISNPSSLTVIFEIVTSGPTLIRNGSNIHSTYWYLSIELLEWLNTSITINIRVNSIFDLTGSTFLIFTNKSFSLKILDETAPRTLETHHQQDLEFNPTNITIFALIEEFGSDIEEVIFFYIFSVGTGSSTDFILQFDEEFSLKMDYHNTTGENDYYMVNLDLDYDQDVVLSYRIQTEDQLGNINPVAYTGEIDLRYNIVTEFDWEFLIAGIIGTVAIFFAVGAVYIVYRRKREEKRSKIAIVNSKLAFLSNTYMILITSAAGVPIWSITNIIYQSDNTLDGNLSGLSVGIDSFLESFQSDFLSQVTAFDLSRDHPERETNFKISVIEQNKIQIMIVGSASYRIFVFLKEIPSEFLRTNFLNAIKDLQRKLPIHDLGIINENILSPNVRMIFRKHLPIGLLSPFRIDIDRLNQVDSILKQGLEDLHITRSGVNTIKLLILAAKSTHIAIKGSNSLLRLYNERDYTEKYSGIFIFSDVQKILSRIPDLSIEDICNAFWLGISDEVKILIPL